MARVLLRVPTTAEKGSVIEIRALIQHVMETGYRPNAQGVVQARDIIWHFTCRYDGEVVFSAALSPAIAANPFIAFTAIATESARSASPGKAIMASRRLRRAISP